MSRACLAAGEHKITERHPASVCPAEPDTPQCFAGGCLDPERFRVENPATPLCEPVTACAAHVGDLLGNAAKSALRSSAVRVTLVVTKAR